MKTIIRLMILALMWNCAVAQTVSEPPQISVQGPDQTGGLEIVPKFAGLLRPRKRTLCRDSRIKLHRTVPSL